MIPVDQLICGDNSLVLESFEPECVDLVVTSPPYDNLRSYNGKAWNLGKLSRQLLRVLKPGGVIVWVVADETVNGSETGSSLRQALWFKDCCGLLLWDTMIWNKGKQSAPTESRYYDVWEFMFVFSKGKPKCMNFLEDRINVSAGSERTSLKNCRKEGRQYGGKSYVTKESGRRFNVWTVNPTCGENGHPAVFPEKLVAAHIHTWSNAGDLVLDPFAGSGTTCKVAKELGRAWCGIEINPEYCAIAEARLAQEVFNL